VHGGVVLVLDASTDPGGAGPARVLEGLRRADVRRLDLVVTASGGSRAAEIVALVRRRFPAAAVLAPPGHRVPGAEAPRPPWSIRAGGMIVEAARAEADAERLRVTVHPP
jgi:hypothetical protein